MLKFTVITPCYNAERFISQTIASVLSQNVFLEKRAELQYVICDGGSTDQTLQKLRVFSDSRISITSERDSGMYDALCKGLVKTTGAIVSYINAGDIYLPGAFQSLSEVFLNEKIKWVTGINGWMNESGGLIGSKTPYIYRSSLIKVGAYGRFLPFIQQESTFWRAELNSTIDLLKLRSMKYAGDYFIWHSLSTHADLVTVAAQFAAFRIHSGQISENKDVYLKEMKSFCSSAGIANRSRALLDRFIWELPLKMKKQLAGEEIITFNPQKKLWS